jgi:hypothetical protein
MATVDELLPTTSATARQIAEALSGGRVWDAIKVLGRNISPQLGDTGDPVQNSRNLMMQLGQFGGMIKGPRATSWNPTVEEAAFLLRGKDRSPEDIYAATGLWAPGSQRRFRGEFSDEGAQLTDLAKIVQTVVRRKGEESLYRPLSAYLEHPELYANYPKAAHIPTRLVPGQKSTLAHGMNDPAYYEIKAAAEPWTTMQTSIPNKQAAPSNVLSNLLHELTHWIQEREGFQAGGSESTAPKVPGLTPWESYARIPGEVEARNVELRQPLTMQQLRALFPPSTYDVEPHP